MTEISDRYRRNAEALVILEEVHRQAPDYRDLNLTYGAALLDAGKPEPALVQFDAALRQGEPTAKLLHLRALTLAELGRRAEAVEAVRQTLKLEPGYPPALELEQQLRVQK